MCTVQSTNSFASMDSRALQNLKCQPTQPKHSCVLSNSSRRSITMEPYVLMIYVTVEQETAIQKLFHQNSWRYIKKECIVYQTPGVQTAKDLPYSLCTSRNSITSVISTQLDITSPSTANLLNSSQAGVSPPLAALGHLPQYSSFTPQLTGHRNVTDDQTCCSSLHCQHLSGHNRQNVSAGSMYDTESAAERCTTKTSSVSTIGLPSLPVQTVSLSTNCSPKSTQNLHKTSNQSVVPDSKEEESNMLRESINKPEGSELQVKNRESQGSESSPNHKPIDDIVHSPALVTFGSQDCDIVETDRVSKLQENRSPISETEETDVPLESIADLIEIPHKIANKNSPVVSCTKPSSSADDIHTQKDKVTEVDEMVPVPDNRKICGQAHGRGEFYCDECGVTFAFAKKFNNHKKNGKCKFSCIYCGKVFTTREWSKYQMHLAYHRNERQYKCDACGKSYNDRSKLVLHQRNHTGEKPFVCHVCGAQFTQGILLRQHIRNKHVAQRVMFGCQLCGYEFKSEGYLKHHVKIIHSDHRPYACEICNKRFKTKYVYTTHLAIHDETGSFQCETCSKTFKRKSYLTNHERRHKKQHHLFCELCGKGFYEKSKLLDHSRSHSGEKPYKCDLCDYRCAIHGNLKKHMKSHARDEALDRQAREEEEAESREAIKPWQATPDVSYTMAIL